MSKAEIAAAVKELGLPSTKKYTAKELTDMGAKFSEKYYRHNLEVFSHILNSTGKDAHHIYPKAKRFADFFTKAGVDVNNPANMKWVNASLHRGKNASRHISEWEKVMQRYERAGKIPSIRELQKEASRIEKMLGQ